MDKRTVLAVGLIIAVIGLYNLFIIPKFSPPPPPPAQQAETAPAPPDSVTPLQATPTTIPGTTPAAVSAIPSPVPVPATPPETIAVDRPLWSASFRTSAAGSRAGG
jgi:hypothetical protein